MATTKKPASETKTEKTEVKAVDVEEVDAAPVEPTSKAKDAPKWRRL